MVKSLLKVEWLPMVVYILKPLVLIVMITHLIPLASQYTYTLLPFWTDLIRDNNSSMLAKSFSDKTVFGWYNMREYNRSGSDNSFEVILWTNDNFEFRYGALDVINHDVLIGEMGSGS